MTRRRQPQPQFHGLDMLPMVGTLIDGQIKDLTAQCTMWTRVLSREPDDATVDRSIQMHTGMLEMANVFDQQLAHWKGQQLTDNQGAEVERLMRQMDSHRDECKRILAFAQGLRSGSGTVRMSDEQAVAAHMRGFLEEAVEQQGIPLPSFALPDEVTMQETVGPRGEFVFQFQHATLGLLGYIFIAKGLHSGVDINPMVADQDPDAPPEVGLKRRAYFGPLVLRIIEWLKQTMERPTP